MLFEIIDARSPRVNFDDARLHQAEQASDIADRDHRLFVSGIDTPDAGVQPLPRMLRKKAFGSRARRASQQAQRPAGEMRKYPVGDFGVKLAQSLFGESRLFPKNSFGVGQTDSYLILRGARPRSLRRLERRCPCSVVIVHVQADQPFAETAIIEAVIRVGDLYHHQQSDGADSQRSSPPTDWPDSQRIFASQLDFLHFMADHKAFTLTQLKEVG